MSKDNTNTMNINFVDLSGQTDEESNVTVGVSDRFNTDEFREMTRKRLMLSMIWSALVAVSFISTEAKRL